MNELYHYGILGMKWGVRKDRRYTDKEISEYRKRKIAEAPTKSVLIREMRREESEASKMNKKVNTRKDAFTLKKGSHIHRSTYDSEDANRDGHAFATFKIKDAKGYASRNKLFSGRKKTFDLTMIAKEDLISPSRKERVSTFVNLMVNDPKFKEAYQAQKQTYQLIKNPNNQTKRKKIGQTIKGLEKEYEMFAVSLGGNEELRKRYFSELNKKGYNMIIDDADAAIISNSPIIVFDRQKSLEVVSINEVNREYLKQLGKGLNPSAQHT